MLTELSSHRIRVLLVDDQPLVGETVRRMLAAEEEIDFSYCKDPTRALEVALQCQPTVILQDLVMPEIQGLDLVKLFRSNDALREVPMIVLSTKEEPLTKAEAFAVGANDYIVKLPDKLELVARIRYHSKGYINLLQRNEAYNALLASQEALAHEVEEAARYVQSLLPPRLQTGAIRADWRFIPSAALGGDTFGYHNIDEDHFAFYLIDVVGHGVGAALLSVSVLNAIRSQSLPETDFLQPGQVITALNHRFQMAQQGDKYFTGWYGVYQASTRTLRYAGGGHPAVLLLDGPRPCATAPRLLESTGPMIGAFEGLEFGTDSATVEPGSLVYLYSDGVFEIQLQNGERWPFQSYLDFVAGEAPGGQAMIDALTAHVREITGCDAFEDDYSIMEFQFEPEG